jgi:flagella basal body P-ring formation protein FlgA
VTGDPVLLADVAALQGFDSDTRRQLGALRVATAPQPGHHHIIHLTHLRDVLRSAAVNLSTICVKGAAQCVVTRPTEAVITVSSADAAQTPPAQTLRHQIEARMQAKYRALGGTLTFEFGVDQAALLAMSGPNYAFFIEIPQDRRLGDLTPRVVITAIGGQRQEVEVPVRVTLFRDVVVARRHIAGGRKIQPEDITVDRQSFSDARQLPCGAVGEVVGQEARRSILAGHTIDPRDLRLVALVQRNRLVGVVSSSDGIVVEGTAMALQAGMLGDIIDVRNPRSEQVYQARVAGLKQVVAIEGGAAVVSQYARGAAQ